MSDTVITRQLTRAFAGKHLRTDRPEWCGKKRRFSGIPVAAPAVLDLLRRAEEMEG